MTVRAPSANGRFGELRGTDARGRPAHRVRGGALPEHRRVLGPRHRHVPDHGRRLHPRLPLLRRHLGPARASARAARAAAGGAGGRAMGLRHVVVTSVDRDDLPDRGAGHFAATIRAIRRRQPDCGVEVLVPDFLGFREDALRTVLEAAPDVFNHNIETAERLYRRVRPKGDYRARSICSTGPRTCGPSCPGAPPLMTKSGSSSAWARPTTRSSRRMRDLRAHRRRRRHDRPVPAAHRAAPAARPLGDARAVPRVPREGEAMGFGSVFAGPLVRSSYRAEEQRLAAEGGSRASPTERYGPRFSTQTDPSRRGHAGSAISGSARPCAPTTRAPSRRRSRAGAGCRRPRRPPATRRAIAVGSRPRLPVAPPARPADQRMPLRDANRSVERLAAPNGARSVAQLGAGERLDLGPGPARSARSSTSGGTSACGRWRPPCRPSSCPAATTSRQQLRVRARACGDHVERRPQPEPVELGEHRRRAVGVRPVVERERDRVGRGRHAAHDPRVAQPARPPRARATHTPPPPRRRPPLAPVPLLHHGACVGVHGAAATASTTRSAIPSAITGRGRPRRRAGRAQARGSARRRGGGREAVGGARALEAAPARAAARSGPGRRRPEPVVGQHGAEVGGGRPPG